MSSNDRPGDPAPGSPEDATRSDWPVEAPAPPPAAAPPPASEPPPGPPPQAPAPWPAPAAAPGYPPGYVPAGPGGPAGGAPGMAWAPPAAAMPGLEYAGAFPRLVAYLVDGLILGVIGLLLSIPAWVIAARSIDWSEIVRGSMAANRYDSIDAFGTGFLVASLIASLIALVIQLLYFVLFWTSGARATLGMRLLGLQVANAADGRTITMGQAVRRWLTFGQWLGLVAFIPVVGAVSGIVQLVWSLVILASTATSPTKQGVHDRIADSVVVQPRGGSGNAWVVGCLVIVAFVVIICVVSIVALIFLGGQISGILDEVGNSV